MAVVLVTVVPAPGPTSGHPARPAAAAQARAGPGQTDSKSRSPSQSRWLLAHGHPSHSSDSGCHGQCAGWRRVAGRPCPAAPGPLAAQRPAAAAAVTNQQAGGFNFNFPGVELEVHWQVLVPRLVEHEAVRRSESGAPGPAWQAPAWGRASACRGQGRPGRVSAGTVLPQ